MYKLNLNNTSFTGNLSDVFQELDKANAKAISCQKHGLQYLVVCRTTGVEIGNMHYSDKENDPIRRSSLRTEALNRKN